MAGYGVDWASVLERHKAFWEGRLTGRCLLSVTAPKAGVGDLPKDTSSAERSKWFPNDAPEAERIKWWTDADMAIARNREVFQSTYFAGDAFPVLFHNLGPACHAGYFKGAIPRYENSIWYEATLKDYGDLEFDPDSFLYQKTIELAKAYANDAKGEYIVSMADTVGAADVLSHLRGPVQFMKDLFDRPDEVKVALKKVQAVWEDILTKMRDAVIQNNYGGTSVGWLMTWAPGLHGQMQCDCSVMISPDMFEEFLCYELVAQSEFMDYGLYHLDGEEQVRHLPHMLGIRGIHAIQWVNVSKQAPCTGYIPELKRIQEAGKGVILYCTPEEVPIIIRSLDPRLLYIEARANTQEEADELVRVADKICGS